MRTLSLFALALSLPAFGQVGNLQVSASALNFTALSGAALPQSQVIGVTSTGVSLPINLSIRYFTPTEGWLSATADRAATPGNVTVTVTPVESFAGQLHRAGVGCRQRVAVGPDYGDADGKQHDDGRQCGYGESFYGFADGDYGRDFAGIGEH